MVSKLMKDKILFIMSDFETSKRPGDNESVYAWLTGFKVCGLMDMKSNSWIDYSELNLPNEVKYFYGKNAVREYLDNLFLIVDICYQNCIGVKVFFHNAKYDFSYLQYYILNECNGYKNKTGNYYVNGCVIDDNNTFYSAKINFKTRSRKGNNGKIKDKTLSVTVHDLYKILPSKLADIGKSLGYEKGKDFDYDMVRQYDYIPTVTEIDGYFKRDIEIMCRAYRNMPPFFYGKYTIGSIVKNLWLIEYLPRLGRKESDLFPNDKDPCEYVYQDNELKYISDLKISDVYRKILQAYKGGMTICNKKYLGKALYNDKLPADLIPKVEGIKIKDDINHYDVNSLYPSVMENNSYPVGCPMVVISDYLKDNTEEFEKYLVNEMIENKKKIIIQICIESGQIIDGKAPLFLKKDICKELYHGIRKNNEIAFDNSYKAFYESMFYNVENITLEEFLLLKNNYKMRYRIETAYIFDSLECLFDDFIRDMAQLKIENDNNEFLRNCYKLCMNNLYGKFGEKIEKITLLKQLDENGDWLVKSNYDKNDTSTNTLIKKNSKYFYPPIAVYVTSYARMKMINFINEVGWENVLYMDTDSLHIIGNAKTKLEEANCIHDTKLGYLKLEDIAYSERVLSPKKYAYYGLVLKKNKEMFKVKCAGLPAEGQEEIKSFDQYYYGLTFIPQNLLNEAQNRFKVISKKTGTDVWIDTPANYIPIGKLAQKNVRGGIYLCPCLFSIRVPDYIKLVNSLDFDDYSIETCML